MRLLVHLHIYYHNQIDYFLSKLANITCCDWDLTVTVVEHNEETEQKLCQFKQNVKIILVENYGYDVWPFIHVIQHTNLDEYDYVLKLHTKSATPKRKLNQITMRGYRWRNELVNALVGSKKHFRELLEQWEEDDTIGLICSALSAVIIDDDPLFVPLNNELQRLRLEPTDHRFCAGTMFMVRAKIVKALQTHSITSDIFCDFIPKSHIDGSMAHIYERVLSLLPSALGYKFMPTYPNLFTRIRVCLTIVWIYIQRLIKWIFSISRDKATKKKYLQILGIKYPFN